VSVDHHRFHVIESVDQVHACFDAQNEQTGGEGVGACGVGADDRHTLHLAGGATGFGADDVVITHPVGFEVALVVAGGRNGGVR
jgi:hypothetical protein